MLLARLRRKLVRQFASGLQKALQARHDKRPAAGDVTQGLAALIEIVVSHRQFHDIAVRLEIDYECPQFIRDVLLKTFRLSDDDLYAIDGPLNPTRLMTLYEGDHSPELRDPPFVAPLASSLRDQPDIFAAIRERDILLHHPYENFDGVVRFLEQAASDPIPVRGRIP